MTEYRKFTLEEWEAVERKAYEKYKERLGKRPTRKTVSREIINENRVNIVYKMAFVLLFAILVFQSIKIVYASEPLANLLVETLSHSEVHNEWALEVFKISTAVVAVLTGTVGLVFMEIFALNSATQARQRETKNKNKLSLEWIVPRLPNILVYLIMLYLFIISNVGNQTIVERLMTNIIVLSELALAMPFGKILSRIENHREAVTQALYIAQKNFDTLYEQYATDPRYLRALLQVAREDFFTLGARGRNPSPNARFRDADTATVESIIADELQRVKGGNLFVSQVTGWLLADHAKRPIVPSEADASKPNDSKALGQRTPPNGARQWATETLINDLIASNAPKDITEKYITSLYANGYNARKVWRKTAKNAWKNR